MNPKSSANIYTEKGFREAMETYMVCVNCELRDRIRAGEDEDKTAVACRGCSAKPGQFHVAGCDFEICPICRTPLMKCEDKIEFD